MELVRFLWSFSQSLSTAAIDVGDSAAVVGVDNGANSTTYFRALDFFSVTLPLPSVAVVLGDVSAPTSDDNLDVISATTIGSRLGRRLVCCEPRPEYLTGMCRACRVTPEPRAIPVSLAWAAKSRTVGRFASGVSFLGLDMPKFNGPRSPCKVSPESTEWNFRNFELEGGTDDPAEAELSLGALKVT